MTRYTQMMKPLVICAALLLSGCATMTLEEQQALQTGFAQGFGQGLGQGVADAVVRGVERPSYRSYRYQRRHYYPYRYYRYR